VAGLGHTVFSPSPPARLPALLATGPPAASQPSAGGPLASEELGLAADAAWLVGAIVLALVLAAVVLASRRFLIERGGGTVECGLRKPAGATPDQPASHRGRWRLGVAAYQLDELRWYSAFGISARPAYTFGRRELMVVSRRRPDAVEADTLGPDRVIVQCRLPGGEMVELALDESALTGLLAWLEAAPPGADFDWAT
jgi:hypothetical protein